MLFHSFEFLIFFPVVFLLYWGLPHRGRKYLLLAASYYFYMCWKPEFIVLILISTLIDYFCGLGIEKYRDNEKRKKCFLAVSLIMNLGFLFFFKYLNFFGETLTALCRMVSIPFSAPVLSIILPVGISFYTFQTMSYSIDVYRGKMKAERDFVSFALYVSFFPQLVAGPIERADRLMPQLKARHTFSEKDASYGLKLMAWGFFKKLVVADRLAALYVDPVYENLGKYSGGALLIATAAFALQVYCDFSGYSDIARGCAKTMGIDLMVNFRAPYLATSMTDFWRRWHISLTDWFREYVYIPLGGNRKGFARKLLFVMITFTLSGLWHGAAWTFVVWGFLQAVYLNAESLLGIGKRGRDLPMWRTALGRLMTFALCCVSLVFFRADSLTDALYVLRRSITGLRDPLQYGKAVMGFLISNKILFAAVVFAVALLMFFDWVNERRDPIEVVSAWRKPVRWGVYTLFLLVLILLIPKEGASPFLYFQF